MKNLSKLAIFIFLAATITCAAPNSKKELKGQRVPKGQKVPTPQRVVEIQKALTAHGYKSGTTWAEIQEICRYIADEHGWQTDHAPDLRVLGLIGLSGPYFDPSVLDAPPNHLDVAQREEAERTGHAHYPFCKKANCTKTLESQNP